MRAGEKDTVMSGRLDREREEEERREKKRKGEGKGRWWLEVELE